MQILTGAIWPGLHQLFAYKLIWQVRQVALIICHCRPEFHITSDPLFHVRTQNNPKPEPQSAQVKQATVLYAFKQCQNILTTEHSPSFWGLGLKQGSFQT